MIVYEPKDWLTVMCSVRGTVISQVFERLWWIVLIAVGAWVLHEREFLPVSLTRPFKPIGHTLLGVALGLLIVLGVLWVLIVLVISVVLVLIDTSVGCADCAGCVGCIGCVC